jgi:cytochrome b561
MTTPAVNYTHTAVVLHWILAVLLGVMIALGLYMTELPRNTPERGWYFNLHKSLGLLAAAVIMVRVGWRLRHAAPRLAGATPAWQAAAAKISHLALYACMVFMPLTGYLGSAFNKYGVKFFGLALPNWAWDDPTLREIFVTAHYWLGRLLIALIIVHVAAALYHALRRDEVFGRMWFGTGRRGLSRQS